VNAQSVQNAINAKDAAYDRIYEQSVRREREQMKAEESSE
jgi:hypothetical protein